MEIDLHKYKIDLDFSYGNWKSIREIIIKISFFHIQSILNDTKNKVQDNEENIYEKIMRNLVTNILGQHVKTPDTTLAELVTIYMHNSLNLDAIIHYEMGGLYALSNKRDYEGYYTPGNSLDICNLFDEIEETVKHYNSSLYDAIYSENKESIYNSFKRGYENNSNIIIKL